MDTTFNLVKGLLARAIGCLALALIISGLPAMEASAQGFQDSWKFKQRDRAGIAVVQKQVDSGMFSGRGTVSGGGASNSTFLVCGGGGGSNASATSNSSCIILNNATGHLDIGQDSLGDQSANSTSSSQIDEVQQILNEAPTGTTGEATVQ